MNLGLALEKYANKPRFFFSFSHSVAFPFVQLSAIAERVVALQADSDVLAKIKLRQQQLDDCFGKACTAVAAASAPVAQLMTQADAAFRMPEARIAVGGDAQAALTDATSTAAAFSNRASKTGGICLKMRVFTCILSHDYISIIFGAHGCSSGPRVAALAIVARRARGE